MTDFDTPGARAAMKQAMTEALLENRDWFRDLVQEALLEVAVAEARREADVRAAYAERQSSPAVPHGQA